MRAGCILSCQSSRSVDFLTLHISEVSPLRRSFYELVAVIAIARSSTNFFGLKLLLQFETRTGTGCIGDALLQGSSMEAFALQARASHWWLRSY